MQIKTENPALTYKIIQNIGFNCLGEIYKVQRIIDGKPFALKYVKSKTEA